MKKEEEAILQRIHEINKRTIKGKKDMAAEEQKKRQQVFALLPPSIRKED